MAPRRMCLNIFLGGYIGTYVGNVLRGTLVVYPILNRGCTGTCTIRTRGGEEEGGGGEVVHSDVIVRRHMVLCKEPTNVIACLG